MKNRITQLKSRWSTRIAERVVCDHVLGRLAGRGLGAPERRRKKR